jgi:hypothetical protein
MLGVSYTFIAYVWFILCNDFLTTNKIRPVFLEVFAAKVLKRIWFWKFDDVEPFYTICFKKSTKVQESKENESNTKGDVHNMTDSNLVISNDKKNGVPSGEFTFLRSKTDLNQNAYVNMSTILPVVTNSINFDADNKNNNEALGSPSDSSASSKTKCNSCDLCENCQKDKQKDKDKKKKKDLVESNVSALNHFACFCLICIEFICNMTVWLLISSPPNSY